LSRDKLRLYQLARELNVDSKDLIDMLKAHGVDVRNHMSTIDQETFQLAQDIAAGKVPRVPRSAPAAAAPAAAPKAAPAAPSAAAPAQIPSPKNRRLTEIPKGKPGKNAETPTIEAQAEAAVEEEMEVQIEVEAPAAEPEPPALEEPEPAPAPEEVVVAQEAPAPTKAAPPKEPTRAIPPPSPSAPIPLPNTRKPVEMSPGGERKAAPRTARNRPPLRPRPVVAAPPANLARPRPEPAKPEVAPQKPVMRLSADAIAGNAPPIPVDTRGAPSELDKAALAEEERRRKGGALTGREERQRRRGQRAMERRQIEGGDDEDESTAKRLLRQRNRRNMMQASGPKGPVMLDLPVTVRSLSEAAGIRANELIRKLMNLGVMASINSSLSDEHAELLAMECGIEIKIKKEETAETRMEASLLTEEEDAPEDLVPRPPIVTFMGHVDHGKTSLMDRIRRTSVAAGESGGITQHIGAYQVATEGGVGKITFLDTPGHEAFTAMRSRGANVTDIVVLVIAADDGVKPQTEEAINHARAANVSIVVAMNKIDLPGANVERLQQQLSKFSLISEAWGGDIPMVPTSATTGAGVDELLETLALVAEVKDPPLTANPKRLARGTCLEASLSEGRGVQATLLVVNGTLRPGDVIVCGDAYGRVRAMYDHQNKPIKEAGPATPVVIAGLDVVPDAGEKFQVLADLQQAREIAEQRRGRNRASSQTTRQHVTLEKFYDTLQSNKVQELTLIIKADVRGSLEAIRKEIGEFQHAEVRVKIIHDGIGGITESDVLLADASDAVIVGFHVAPDDRAMALASEKGVEIRRYEIIYQVLDDVKKALEGLLKPETREIQLGRVVVQEIFNISRVGNIAGCRVVQGTIERAAKLRIIRDGSVIGTYPIETLRRFKDDVKEVREGMECGIKLSNFDDIKRDDVLEAFKIEEIKRTL
jgi:translation initiation factor IF-2